MIKDFILRRIKRTLRKKEFWFTVTVYPVFAAGYFYVKNNAYLYEMVNSTGPWYFVISYIIALYLVFMVGHEILEKKLKHKVQGDKLKQKQQGWR